MTEEEMEDLIRMASGGDTTQLELLFTKPGGRKFLETIIVVMVTQMPVSRIEKFRYVRSFIKIMDKLEERIKHQRQGDRILKQIFTSV